MIDWPTLRRWCLAHGAKTDSITLIQIDGTPDGFNVILEGHELIGNKPFMESRHEVAKWRSVAPLKALP